MMDAPASVRAFISLDLPEAIKREAGQLLERLSGCGADVRWVQSAGLHLTLQFLGQISMSRVPEIIQALEPVVARVHPIRIRVRGVGAFPHLGSPRVVWAGIQADEGLMELKRDVEEATSRLGFRPETRPFQPHLTLGRVKSAKKREALIAALGAEKGWAAGDCELSKICLMKSELQPGGAVYTPLWSKVLSY